MPGAQPVKLLKMNGSKQMSGEAFDSREAREIRLGSGPLEMPEDVEKNARVRPHWERLAGLYAEFEFVSNADAELVRRYCYALEDYEQLRKDRKLFESDIVDLSRIDRLVNAKADLLTKMEDRLYLNPSSRIKSIPASRVGPKEADPLEEAGFGDV
jgi:phage terminase small subunit